MRGQDEAGNIPWDKGSRVRGRCQNISPENKYLERSCCYKKKYYWTKTDVLARLEWAGLRTYMYLNFAEELVFNCTESNCKLWNPGLKILTWAVLCDFFTVKNVASQWEAKIIAMFGLARTCSYSRNWLVKGLLHNAVKNIHSNSPGRAPSQNNDKLKSLYSGTQQNSGPLHWSGVLLPRWRVDLPGGQAAQWVCAYCGWYSPSGQVRHRSRPSLEKVPGRHWAAHTSNIRTFNTDRFLALQRHNENLKQIFPEKEWLGLSPNFRIHVSESQLCIPMIALPILLQDNMWTDPGT